MIATDDKPEHVDRVLSKPPKMAELRGALAELVRPRDSSAASAQSQASILEGHHDFLAVLARAGDLGVQAVRRSAVFDALREVVLRILEPRPVGARRGQAERRSAARPAAARGS